MSDQKQPDKKGIIPLPSAASNNDAALAAFVRFFARCVADADFKTLTEKNERGSNKGLHDD